MSNDNLLGREFICLKNYKTNILSKSEEQLIFHLNKYYGLLNRLQDIFQINYMDKIIDTAKTKCPLPSNTTLQKATLYVYCLGSELLDYASTIKT